MLEQLKREVLEANLLLPRYGLVSFTWGNVSGIDRKHGLVVIKPSGVAYERMTAEEMVVVDLDGRIVDGELRPSSDLPTHLELYRAFPQIGGVVHTHSQWATVFAQAGRDIPAYGTTHADCFYGSVPCTGPLTTEEINGTYEKNTGLLITRTFAERGLNAEEMSAVLVRSHGPFCWGKNPADAVENAAVLEKVAEMAYYTERLGQTDAIPQPLLDRHYLRKHGKNAYYGQK